MSGSITDALKQVYKVAKEYGIDLGEKVGDSEDVQVKALFNFAANMPEILDLPQCPHCADLSVTVNSSDQIFCKNCGYDEANDEMAKESEADEEELELIFGKKPMMHDTMEERDLDYGY